MEEAINLYLNSSKTIEECANIYFINRKKLAKEIKNNYPNYRIIKFKNLSNIIHNNKFDYSLVNFSKYRDKVKIICPVHGIFEQEVFSHTKGRDCQLCASIKSGLKRLDSKEEFVSKSKIIHGDFYDYSKVNLLKDSLKVIITCSIHGDFEQIPYDHKHGKGCSTCALENKGWNFSQWSKASKGREGILYVIECSLGEERFLKIGRTFNSVKRRYDSKKMIYNYKIIKELISSNLKRVWEMERDLKRLLKSYQVTPINKFEGWTECFSIDSIPIILNYAETH